MIIQEISVETLTYELGLASVVLVVMAGGSVSLLRLAALAYWLVNRDSRLIGSSWQTKQRPSHTSCCFHYISQYP